MITIAKLLVEARRRSVFRSGGIYIVGAWVFIQVAQLALQSLDYPDNVLRHFWLAALAAFPVLLIFAWRYDITSDGVRRTPPVNAAETVDLGLRASDYALLTALSVIAIAMSAGVINEVRQIDPVSTIVAATGTNPNSVAILPLTARNSTLHLNKSFNAPRIGTLLNVVNIVEGSVSRAGNRISVTLHLIKAATDELLWSETYDREIGDVQSLQDETTRAITAIIKGRLSLEDEELLAKKNQSSTGNLRSLPARNISTAQGDARGLQTRNCDHDQSDRKRPVKCTRQRRTGIRLWKTWTQPVPGRRCLRTVERSRP